MNKRKNTTLAKSMGSIITEYRKKKFPGHGGQKKCYIAYGADAEKWSRWENGKVTPTDRDQKKLAGFFGITLGELRGESNFDRNPLNVLVDKVVTESITYGEKGEMVDSAGVDFLKDHLATLKQDKADLQAKVALLEKELADLREENKRLLTLSSAKDTRPVGSG